MIRVIEFLREARGWRRAGLALTSGMIAALSMPPFDFWPLLFAAFPVVLVMLEGIPFGMELLATVHWVATHDPRPTGLDAVIDRVHGWNERKRQEMKPGHIEAAWHRLREHGWIASATPVG